MPYCSCASDASAAGGASAESPPRFPQSAALAYPPFVRSSRTPILDDNDGRCSRRSQQQGDHTGLEVGRGCRVPRHCRGSPPSHHALAVRSRRAERAEKFFSSS